MLAIAALILFAAIFPLSALAQEQSSWEAWALSDIVPGAPTNSSVYTVGEHTIIGTNGICVRYSSVKTGETVLMADSASVNQETGEAVADGHVRIEMGGQLFVGEHINYNFKTQQMRSEQFRTGKPPVFATGKNLQGDLSNQVYTAQHAYVTSDDVSDPAVRIRASRIRMVPGEYVEAWNAVVFMDGVPAFYFPHYKRNLGPHANNWNFTPGYSSAYGPFLLSAYNWWLNDSVDGVFHIDYREQRGPGIGPDLNLHLGRWGEAGIKYYYTHDQDSGYSQNTNNFPGLSNPVPENRQRVYFGWQATPSTNLNLKACLLYTSPSPRDRSLSRMPSSA